MPTFCFRRFGADFLALGRFGAKTFWRKDVLAPRRFGAVKFWRHSFFFKIEYLFGPHMNRYYSRGIVRLAFERKIYSGWGFEPRPSHITVTHTNCRGTPLFPSKQQLL